MPEIACWVVLGLVSALCAALVSIFGKLGLEDVGPDRLSVAFIVARAALFLGESLTRPKLIGATLTVAGARVPDRALATSPG